MLYKIYGSHNEVISGKLQKFGYFRGWMMRLQTFTKICFFISFLYIFSFSDSIPFISKNGDCRYPTVASEGDTLYLVWILADEDNAGIYFRRSVDGGKVWSDDQRLSNAKSFPYPPAIAVNSGVVHAAWVDFGMTVDGELHYIRSFDGGKTWGNRKILMKNANSARYPFLKCKSEYVYLVWQDDENTTYFKASHDKGLTWVKETILAKLGEHSCYCYPPAISVNRDEVSVAWTDVSKVRGFRLLIKGLSGKNVVSTIARRKSTDAGVTWGDKQVLVKTMVAKETQDEIDNPAMLSEGSFSYLFWLDKRNYKLGEIFFARLDFEEDRFPISGQNLLPFGRRSPKRPEVVFDKEKHFHLTWVSFLGGKSIVYYCQSDPEGNVLIEKKKLTSEVGRYHYPVIAQPSSGLLNVLWFDEPKEGRSRIFLKRSKDNGLTWEDWEGKKL